MLLTNCRIVSAGVDQPGTVEIRDNRIIAIHAPQAKISGATYDCGGRTLMPGFIDIHTHGAVGCDWTDGSLDSVRRLARYYATTGVTTVIPTSMSLPFEALQQMFRVLREYAEQPEPGNARLGGVHLEGPYLHPEALGGHNPNYIRLPDLDEVRKLHAIYPVAKITLATDLPRAHDMIEALTAMGIAVAAGHSKAGIAEIQDAMRLGVTHLCHLGNQMTPLHHREIGMVGAGLLLDELAVEVIADRIHLSPEMLALVAKVKPTDRVLLITDSISATGLPPGEYVQAALQIVVANGEARLKSNGALAGSFLQMATGLKNYQAISALPWSEAIKSATVNPARAVGLTGNGEIRPGLTADLVLLNPDFSIAEVWVNGQTI